MIAGNELGCKNEKRIGREIMGKKGLAALLCGTMLLGLGACGSGGNTDSSADSGSAGGSSTASESQTDNSQSAGSTSASSSAGSEKTADLSDLEFYMVDPLVGNPYWDNVYQGAAEAAEYYGVTVTRVGPTAIDYDEQISYMETAIADGCNGIFTAALAPDTFAPVIQKAIDADIPVVLIDSDAENTERTLYAGTSNYAAGYTAGEAMAEALGGKGQVAVMVGAIDAQNMIDREAGFRDAIAQYPDMEVVTTEASDTDYTIGVSKASATLLTYPELAGFYGASATDGAAIATALQENGKSQGDVTVIAMDDNPDTMQFIEDGWIYGTTVQNTYAMGWYGVMYLYQINKGELPMEKQEGKDVIDTGVVLVTKENADTYQDEMPVDKAEP